MRSVFVALLPTRAIFKNETSSSFYTLCSDYCEATDTDWVFSLVWQVSTTLHVRWSDCSVTPNGGLCKGREGAVHITGVEMKLELSVSDGVLLRTKTFQKRWAAAGMAFRNQARQANKMDGASDINIALSKGYELSKKKKKK